MPNFEIELNPVDFITVGTVGPKGQRVFHLQAGKGDQIVSLVIEKEQAWALSEALKQMIAELEERFPKPQPQTSTSVNMDLREPIEPLCRVAQMGIGYDQERDLIVLVAQELVTTESDEEDIEPGVVRLWSTREQMRLLSEHSGQTVKSGRPDPKQNGRIVYYWT